MRTKLASLTLCLSLTAACSGATTPDNSKSPTNMQTANNATNLMTANNTTSSNNAAAYAGLFINEVAATGDPDDWFELYNGSDAAIDLGGLTYSDDLTVPDTATIPAGTMLAAGAFMVFDATDTAAGFKLGGDEALGLFTADGAEIDSVDWNEGDSPAGKSFGRIPDGTGEFITLNAVSPGAPNIPNDPNAPVCGDGVVAGDETCDGATLGDATCEMMGFAGGDLSCNPACDGFVTDACEAAMGDVVVNEVTSTGDDQIELYNRGGGAIDLTGWFVTDDGWVAGDATTDDHKFELTGMLESSAFLVLVKDTDHLFGIGGQDAVMLYDASGNVVDQTTWADGDAATSWCRIPDGTGDFAVCTATFGATNSQ